MAVKAAYELPYTGEEVEDLLKQVPTNTDAINEINESMSELNAVELTIEEIDELTNF